MLKIRFNFEEYKNKLHGCWIGKNIGGTIGAPYEGQHVMQNAEGFNSPPGEPLPNDDLDLQLLWLYVVENCGVRSLSPTTLASFWLDGVAPYWNEYGIAKTNLKLGLLPPLSGEYDNGDWRDSNGAWIRSEIWAGFAPGVPDLAIKYAVMDAQVDHGYGEGTIGEIFTAAMQSYAYLENSVKKIIGYALSKIPEDSYVSKAVKLACDMYEKGETWQNAREAVVRLCEKFGWFQAPQNIAFAVIGLLWGEGDFKKSVLTAVNCGDDTDCTGATVGATLGIIYGADGIPQDWKDYIGDRILTVAINGDWSNKLPKTCSLLTEHVTVQVRQFMMANHVNFDFTNEKTEFEDIEGGLTAADLLCGSPYSFRVTDSPFYDITVEYGKRPDIVRDEPFTVKFEFKNKQYEPRHFEFKVMAPDEWEVGEYRRTSFLLHDQFWHPEHSHPGYWEFTVTARGNINAKNYVYVAISSPAEPTVKVVPVVFIG